MMHYRKLVLIVWSLFLVTITGFGQSFSGIVLDRSSLKPISYVNIYNQHTGKGTISDENGYFKIPINSQNDTLIISCIGYQSVWLYQVDTLQVAQIKLKESNKWLEEVNVYASDNSYLYDLVLNCRKSFSTKAFQSKAFYQLQTYVDQIQTELVEGYYNAEMNGPQLKSLSLRAGRFALRPFGNRLFASLESSRAIVMFLLFHHNDYFPEGPLNLNKKQLHRSYYLDLTNRYLDENQDSIYVLSFTPRIDSTRAFSGKLWINNSNFQLIKLEYRCVAASIHPFLPHVTGDSISGVDLFINETFECDHSISRFKSVDFNYVIRYRSRVGTAHEKSYSLSTNAILYSYSYENIFPLPFFNFSDAGIGDYRKMNAFPYNSFFWDNNDEYKINHQNNANTLFFTDSNSITNRSLFTKNNRIKRGLFEHPFISWTGKRIFIKESGIDTSLKVKTDFKSDKYLLSVKYYVDYCSYNGIIHIETSTILDPYQSYYALPIDAKANCFINLYFDYCELQRRNLENILNKNRLNYSGFKQAYFSEMEKIQLERDNFMRAVERGTNRKAMEMYNAEVKSKLGIDNIALFKPYEE